MVPINEIIKKHAKKTGYPVSKLASALGISTQALYQILKTPNITTSRLQQISQALNHNFFQYYITQSTNPLTDPIHLQHEIDRLTTKVAHLQQEITYLKEINQLLKA
ncbi:MAG: helix-turn-helix transcriptional regulator [Bacteroidales bacterium]